MGLFPPTLPLSNINNLIIVTDALIVAYAWVFNHRIPIWAAVSTHIWIEKLPLLDIGGVCFCLCRRK